MSLSDVKKLQTGVTRRYVLALTIIALLSTAAFFVLNEVIHGTEDTAYVVNISGKQRMLSQIVALDVHRLSQLQQEWQEGGQGYALHQQETFDRLTANISEMRQVNQRLSHGQVEKEVSVTQPLSLALQNLYFGDVRLANKVDAYLNLATQVAESDSPSLPELIQISYQAKELLPFLDKAVSIYQQEGEDKLYHIKQIELMVLLITLFMLVIEVLFIFQPMVRHIAMLSEENLDHVNNLEKKVALRTLRLNEANQKLKEKASHDSLTGLYNRLNLERDIEQCLHHFQEYNTPYAVMLIDIDYFKQVNDQFGHLAGDDVLVELASKIEQSIRNTDMAYRVGGEEFVVVLNHCELIDATNRAEQIREAVGQHTFEYPGQPLKITISIGLYHSSLRESKTVNHLMRIVDDALYQSKNRGRNCVTQVNDKGKDS